MALSTPAVAVQIVQDKYSKSEYLVESATRAVRDFQRELTDNIYSPPQISVQWQTLAAPTLPDVPELPDLPSLDTALPGGEPTPFSGTLPEVDIDDFEGVAPALNIPQAPALTIGRAPNLPEVRDVDVPDAPDVDIPDAPQFLALQTHMMGNINLHEDWLDKLGDIPELSLAEPTPFDYSPGKAYSSQLLADLKQIVRSRVNGGTGLSPVVEQEIWDRARDRETQIALAKEQEVLRQNEALGFALPSGVLAGQLADARREYHDKLSTLSRDIAIKQADLEQSNVQNAISAALQLEGALLDNSYKLEMLAFETAKAAADNAIQANNAAIEHFKALLSGYQMYASAYDTIIKAETAKIDIFRARLQAEETKANINKSLVDRYRAEIDARMSVVEIYKARVGAAQTLVEIERARIQAGGEQVRAFVATVNAETAKADMYKAIVSAEATKQEAFGTQVRAYGAKVSAQAERARANAVVFQSRVQAKTLEWDAWKSKLQAAVSEAEIKARVAGISIDGYRAGAAAVEANAGAYMRRWEADIKQYEAGQSLTFQAADANARAIMHTNDARLEAAKIGLAASTQELASAWGLVATSASVSSSASDIFNYQM